MNLHDGLVEPMISPLPHTSPAINEELRSCFMRAAFQTDPRFSNIRPISTLTVLGAVSHQLLEAACRGEFDNTTQDALLEADIRNRWLELARDEMETLQTKAFDTIPLPQQWPKYALRMVAACRAAFRIAARRNKRHVGDDTVLADKARIEVWYEGCNGKLAGRIDLIRFTSSGIELVDYKSGAVMQQGDADGNTQQLQERYERQMLLYASLVHENEGQWPTITVESLIDGPHLLSYTPKASEETVAEALLLLDTYNHRASSGGVRGAPDEDCCRWCSFKVFCREYLETVDESWSSPLKTVIGRLVSMHAEPPSFLTLQVTGGDHHRGIVNIRGIPGSVVSAIQTPDSCLLSFGNMKRAFGARDLIFGWDSVFWRWSD